MRKIQSVQSQTVKHLTKLVRVAGYRKKCSSFVIEGKKMINEIKNSDAVIQVLSVDEKLIPKRLIHTSVLCTQAVIDKIVTTRAPEGIVCEMKMPKAESFSQVDRLLVLDRVTDPGNLGTLIRSAYALSWDAVFLLEGSVDPYNDKALRASKGATLKTKIKMGSFDELISFLKKEKFTVYAADVQGEDVSCIKEKDTKLALILGNEALGLSNQTKNISKLVSIPIETDVESLNVSQAGAILLYQFKRKK